MRETRRLPLERRPQWSRRKQRRQQQQIESRAFDAKQSHSSSSGSRNEATVSLTFLVGQRVVRVAGGAGQRRRRRWPLDRCPTRGRVGGGSQGSSSGGEGAAGRSSGASGCRDGSKGSSRSSTRVGPRRGTRRPALAVQHAQLVVDVTRRRRVSLLLLLGRQVAQHAVDRRHLSVVLVFKIFRRTDTREERDNKVRALEAESEREGVLDLSCS